MNDNRDKQTGSVSPEWEMQLAREIRDLEPEMMPSRDLWAGIERRIAEHPQPKKTDFRVNWMGFGMAASVLMAFSALTLTVLNTTGAGSTSEPVMAAFNQPGSAALETLQVEYLKTRDPLVQQFTETNRSLAPATLEELYRNIEIMAKARKDIEAQVREDPTNSRLVELLMRIHEQELELLKQDFSQPTRTM